MFSSERCEDRRDSRVRVAGHDREWSAERAEDTDARRIALPVRSECDRIEKHTDLIVHHRRIRSAALRSAVTQYLNVRLVPENALAIFVGCQTFDRLRRTVMQAPPARRRTASHRPLAPTKLPCRRAERQSLGESIAGAVAEREGFEPPIGLHLCRISSAVLSTTQPPLQTIAQPDGHAGRKTVSGGFRPFRTGCLAARSL